MSQWTINFQGILEKFSNSLYNYHVKVPHAISKKIKEEKIIRFLCQINDGEMFHASLMPAGESLFFIKINKELRKKHKLTLNDSLMICLQEDESKYGMPLPKEMEELFLLDPEGNGYFHKLTAGKQRGLLYLVGNVKNSNKRTEKSFIILEHLKEQKGTLDFKILHQDFKEKKGII